MRPYRRETKPWEDVERQLVAAFEQCRNAPFPLDPKNETLFIEACHAIFERMAPLHVPDAFVDDLAQDATLKILEHLRKYELSGIENIVHYIKRASLRICLNAKQRWSKHFHLVSIYDSDENSSRTALSERIPAKEESSPEEDQTEKEALLALFLRMKDRILSPTQNKVISGYYLEGLEFQQMIEEMMKKKDISRFQAQNSIKGAKSSGLKRLREELSPYLSQI